MTLTELIQKRASLRYYLSHYPLGESRQRLMEQDLRDTEREIARANSGGVRNDAAAAYFTTQ